MSGMFGGGATSKQTSPVNALNLQNSTRGIPIPLAYGKPRIPINLIEFVDLAALAHSDSSGGGKGGGPAGSVNYTYTSGLIMAICAGAINSVTRVWRDKEIYSGIPATNIIVAMQDEAFTIPLSLAVTVANAASWTEDLFVTYAYFDWEQQTLLRKALTPGVDYTVRGGVYVFAGGLGGLPVYISYNYTIPVGPQDAASQVGLSTTLGTYSQVPPGWMTTKHPTRALAYRGLAYLSSSSYGLGDNATLQNHSVEVDTQFGYSASIRDANPKDVLIDLLTNPYYGAGFPASLIGDCTVYSQFCVANNLFISPAYTERLAVRDMISKIMSITNSDVVFSSGKINFLPYGDIEATANGVTYTPNITPIYDLNDDDFLSDGTEDPIKITRTPNSDAYNSVRIKFYNRENNYNEEIAEAKDQANIELYGLRAMDVIEVKEICDATAARNMAQLVLQRGLYIRNKFEFRLGWNKILLEPMDLVTLTESGTGMNKLPVRILSIAEDDKDELTFTAEEYPLNVCNVATYGTQTSLGNSTNFNIAPSDVNPPVIFEPTDQLTSDLEVWMGVSGLSNYGGCDVWVSYDNEIYKKIGRTTGAARTGYLYASLPSGDAVDQVNLCEVDLAESLGELLSGTEDDANNNRTLCYVDGELVSYATATLSGASKYSLSYLNRGAYGSSIGGHASGKRFARLDDTIFKYPFSINDIGRTIFIKFQAFNQFAGGLQDLASLQFYSYKFAGSALNSPLPNVANLTNNFIAGITNLHWDEVTDFRSPIDYEVRMGVSWASAQVIGRTPLLNIPVIGDGLYWVAAHYRSPSGFDAYSATPSSIMITGAVLVRNVVQTYDESATGWSGTLGGGAALFGGNVILTGAGDWLASTDFLAEPSIIWMDGVAPLGSYQIPSSHQVDVGRVAACNVSITPTGYAASIFDNFLTLTNVLDVVDLFYSALGIKINLQAQIRTAQADGIYGAWQNFIPGTYNAQYFDARVLLISEDPQVFAVLTGLVFTVDMPDRLDQGTNVPCPSGGLTVLYTSPFNIIPNVQITILNAVAGDDVRLTSYDKFGFTVQIENGGIGVARNINHASQGY